MTGELSALGVGHGIYYPIAIHQQELYRGLGYSDRLPNTETATQQVLSLPVHPSLSESDIEEVASAVKEAVMKAQSPQAVVA